MAAVTPARYFIAAAVVLLLGASAMPEAMAALSVAGSGSDTYATAMGVWAVLVVVVAVGGPILLTLAGIIALGTRRAAPPAQEADPTIEDAVAWLSDEPQISGRR
jgi:hypothetical protein